jgi:hypothetical protein
MENLVSWRRSIHQFTQKFTHWFPENNIVLRRIHAMAM